MGTFTHTAHEPLCNFDKIDTDKRMTKSTDNHKKKIFVKLCGSKINIDKQYKKITCTLNCLCTVKRMFAVTPQVKT